jgi:hypothetical protein
MCSRLKQAAREVTRDALQALGSRQAFIKGAVYLLAAAQLQQLVLAFARLFRGKRSSGMVATLETEDLMIVMSNLTRHMESLQGELQQLRQD